MADGHGVFRDGGIVFLKIAERPYKATIQSFEPWRHLTVRLTKVDSSLVYKASGEKVTVTCIDEQGIAHSGETSLMKKALPTIVLHYPENMEGTSIRKHERVPVSIWVSIRDSKPGQDPKVSPVLGDGTLVDLSPEGARLMTEVKNFNVGQAIILEFQLTDEHRLVRIPSVVRNSHPAPYSCLYYGVKFVNLPEGFPNALESFLQHPVS